VDHLWSPWRYRYVTRADPASGCVFCEKPAQQRDEENFIVHRGEFNFVILNLYPYSSGHLLIVPYAHAATLDRVDDETAVEMMRMARRASGLIRKAYKAPGMNIGMNVGECAGAGVAGHIHLHVVPRWPGDVNFMTAAGETRIMPEDLRTTFEKLRSGW